jgi:hypothetical protein
VQQRAEGDDAATVPAAVARTGDPRLAGLPDTAAGFAQAVVRLHDQLAPKVALAWHPTNERTDGGTFRGLASRCARAMLRAQPSR